jgi:FSR family fosmidomycin resistance protein-like MFS transporter
MSTRPIAAEPPGAQVAAAALAGAGAPADDVAAPGANVPLLLSISLAHGLNDLTQSLLLAMYPVIKGELQFSYRDIGLISLCYNLTACLLQPLVGLVTDRHPMPFSLACGMLVSMGGVLLLSTSHSLGWILAAAAMIGVGSSIFHPEASRIARLSAGRRYGMAQAVFQVGGNSGSAIGPWLATFVPTIASIARFAVLPLLGALVLLRIGFWSRSHHASPAARRREAAPVHLSSRRTAWALAVLVALVTTKVLFLAGLSTYFTFFLIDRFHLSNVQAQTDLFYFMAAAAAGTFLGGPIGDRIGRKAVIWCSIVGAAPFALLLPYAGLQATVGLAMMVGLVISSAFSAMLVMAQELLPGRVGLISGLFFGLSFGIGGISASALGALADHMGIQAVFRLTAFLPLLGMIAAFLPNLDRARATGGAR